MARLSTDYSVPCQHAPSRFFKSLRPISRSFTVAYAIKDPQILNLPRKTIAGKAFIRQSIWQKMLSAAWHQPLFLSIPTKLSSKYIIELNYLNINNQQNIGKNLVARFSQSLLDGSVCSSLSSNTPSHFTIFSSIHYMWSKSLKLHRQKLLNLFRTNDYLNYLQYARGYLNQNTSMNHVPLFTVYNNLGQMVISEPPSILRQEKGLVRSMPLNATPQCLYHAWFFTNFEDAQEYMDFISEYYNLKKSHLKIFTCSLSTFYDIAARLNHKVQVKLVPDLEEVSSLIKRYKYYSHVSFHSGQNHGSVYFQGQPMYILKIPGQYMYTYEYSEKKMREYPLAFTSYKTACSVLNKIAAQPTGTSHVNKPSLTVYNLESFIHDQLLLGKKYQDSFLLVPSQESYLLAKNCLLRKNAHLVYDTVVNHLLSLRLWSKRVAWSLTSRQPSG